MNIAQSKNLPLDELLSRLGFRPEQVRGGGADWWFLSPLRLEMEPSFHVDLRKNRWHDFGAGEGGDALDLICRLRGFSKKEGLVFLADLFAGVTFPIEKPQNLAEKNLEKAEADGSALRLLAIKNLEHPALLEYLERRKIGLETARAFLSEAHFSHRSRRFFALAMANRAGGWEIRNAVFKSSLGPKSWSFFDGPEGAANVAVFEGMMDFLTWREMAASSAMSSAALVLHSLSFQKKAADWLETTAFSGVFCYFDADRAGEEAALFFQNRLTEKVVVSMQAEFFGHKDLNEFWVASGL